MENQTTENRSHKVVVSKIIHAKRERVFEAFTKPELMQQWFKPMGSWSAKTSNDLRVGGSYAHTMTANSDVADTNASSCSAPDVAVHPHTGEYLVIDPPHKLVFTWNSNSAKNSRVTVEFKERKGDTEVTIIHELDTEEQRINHTDGWSKCLESLAIFLG